MTHFVKKKLQVFVSSTYEDLKDERQAAVQSILTAEHIPAGMELFTAGDEAQLAVIKQWIDESDIYLLILGGRYGSIEPTTGKSYTHLEYEYALSKNKPLFACVMEKAAMDTAINEHIAKDRKTGIENSQKLEDFQAVVQTKMVKFWKDSKDIKIAVSETLAIFARRDDLLGWVRPNTEENIPAHIAEEIARLSKENAELRSQLKKNGAEATINGLSFDELKVIVEQKDLLNFLEERKTSLALCVTASHITGGVPDEMRKNNNRKLLELCELGLVSSEYIAGKTARYFKLSNAGLMFLNKLDLWKSKQTDDSQN